MQKNGGYSDVLIGLQYGDEGKAKVIDQLAPCYDVIARFNGGANAGHTIDTPSGRIALKQMPSGVFHEKTRLYVGSGCALNLAKFVKEIRDVKAFGVELSSRLAVSARCAVVQPIHILLDRLNGRHIGTTGNGMGPCYADRALRMRSGRRVNVQLKDLLADEKAAIALMVANVENDLGLYPEKAQSLREEAAAMVEEIPALVAEIRPYVTTDAQYLTRLVEGGAKVLFEGAQSVELDVVAGEQPFVTASHTVPGHAYVGGDLSPRWHRRTIGVAKAVMSRVGQGPFATELGGGRSAEYCASASVTGRGRADEEREHDPERLLASADDFDVGMALRMITNEYGTGTGRPRRIGMLDMVQLRDAVHQHGVDAVFLTKCDCLALYGRSHYEGFPVALGYDDEHGAGLRHVTMPAFELPADGHLTPDRLPAPLLALRDLVERETGAHVFGLGVGPGREASVQFFEWQG